MSKEAGQTASWAVAAWAEGGNATDVTVKLVAAPAGDGTPAFSSGCGNHDGTASCDLGSVDSSSAARQLQAQVTIPQTATGSAVSLTASISATGLTTGPRVSGAVTVLAAATPVGVSDPLTALAPAGVAAPTPDTTLSPGGSATGLFPTVAPTAAGDTLPPSDPPAVQAANDSALRSSGSDPVGAQIAGLAALALAAFFAVTRVSIRRPARASAGKAPATADVPAEDTSPAGAKDAAPGDEDKGAPGPSSPG